MSDLPHTIWGETPESIEKVIEEQNLRNGHVGVIESYTIITRAPPVGLATCKKGWAAVERKYREIFGEPYDAVYKANVRYEPKR